MQVFSVLKYEVDETSLKNLDALITVSAEDPEAIFNSLKLALPPLAQVKLTKDSDPIDLSTIIPFPAELNIHPELAIKGKHLVIYNGEESKKLANALTSEKLSQNGIYSLSTDFKELFTPIISTLKIMGKDIPEQFSIFCNLQYKYTHEFRCKRKWHNLKYSRKKQSESNSG